MHRPSSAHRSLADRARGLSIRSPNVGPHRVFADRRVHARPLPVLERRLDQPVLAAVEADDRGPAAGLQAPRQHPQQLLKVGQLAVDQDAQGLEDPGRRPDLLLARRRLALPRVRVDRDRGRFEDQVHQLARPFERPASSAGGRSRRRSCRPPARRPGRGRRRPGRRPAGCSAARPRSARGCGPCACRAGRRA